MPEPKAANPSDHYFDTLSPDCEKLVVDMEARLLYHNAPEKTGSFLIYELGDCANTAKTFVKDELASYICTLSALAVAASSDNINETAAIEYEDGSSQTILLISDADRQRKMGIPISSIHPVFLSALEEKLKEAGSPIEHVKPLEQNTDIESVENAEIIKKMAINVYKQIGTYARVAEIENLIEAVNNNETVEGQTRSEALILLVRQCREAVDREGGVEALADERLKALSTL